MYCYWTESHVIFTKLLSQALVTNIYLLTKEQVKDDRLYCLTSGVVYMLIKLSIVVSTLYDFWEQIITQVCVK